jgi:hypothetical protein
VYFPIDISDRNLLLTHSISFSKIENMVFSVDIEKYQILEEGEIFNGLTLTYRIYNDYAIKGVFEKELVTRVTRLEYGIRRTIAKRECS